MQVVAFGIGLMVLLLLTSVRTELMTQWQATLPADAPNHFLINIQPEEREALSATLVAAGVPEPRFTPLVRARISHINGVPVADYRPANEFGRRELEDETNLTWSAELPPANEIVSGEWWSEGADVPQLSLEEELRAAIGLDARRRDHVRDRRREPHGSAHEHAARSMGVVPAEFLHGALAGRDRTIRAYLHHEPVRHARAAAA